MVLVGTRKDSETYVRSKKKSSVEVGFQSFGTELPEDATEEQVLQVGPPLNLGTLPARPQPCFGYNLQARCLSTGPRDHGCALQVVQAYNADPNVHGILVQLPLPKHINETRILDAISIDKDVDGFHPENIGCLAMRGRNPKFVSCTPKVRRTPCPCGLPMTRHLATKT